MPRRRNNNRRNGGDRDRGGRGETEHQRQSRAGREVRPRFFPTEHKQRHDYRRRNLSPDSSEGSNGSRGERGR